MPLDFAGPRGEVTVWRDRVSAFDQGDEPAAWISALLGRDARLVRIDPAARRRCDPAWTADAEAHSRFSDGYPLLVVSRASLDDLNSRLPAPLPMDRFRPNLVLDGLPPYGEDEVHEFTAEGIRLRVVKPCTRCSITTTDQAAGVVAGDEPLRTLKSYRWDAALHGVTFGQNTIVIEGAGSTLEAGMSLTAIALIAGATGSASPGRSIARRAQARGEASGIRSERPRRRPAAAATMKPSTSTRAVVLAAATRTSISALATSRIQNTRRQ